MSWSFKIARHADIEVRIMLVPSLRRPTAITAWRAQRPGLPA